MNYSTQMPLPWDHRTLFSSDTNRGSIMWDYAALAKEAGLLGGPEGLRNFYREQGGAIINTAVKGASRRGSTHALRYFSSRQGMIMGAALTGAGVAGTVLYDKWHARRAVVKPAPQTTETLTPGESTDA
ncbi:hypothetical protein ACIRO3_34535 [Streptomyces sp. NPDC102278]|uniref:hypothetical protein n=1 Tax=Streptomyces sp. NPDC102278 TaxID=3366152 RepID=UPI00380FD8E0